MSGCGILGNSTPINTLAKPTPVTLDDQVMASADGSLIFTPTAPAGTDGQVNYDAAVDACVVVKKIVTTPPAVGSVTLVGVDSNNTCVPVTLPNAIPAVCPTGNTQVVISADLTAKKVQSHLAPVLAPAAVSIGQMAYFKANGAVAVNDGTACDDGHICGVKNVSHLNTVAVTVNLVGAPGTVINMAGIGAYGQGGSIYLMWIQAESGYIIV